MKDLLLTRCRLGAVYVARLCACMLLLSAGPVSATERFHVSTLKFVYPVASGDFVLGLDSDSSYCTSASTPNKYYHIVVAANGMTLEGSKKLFAAALTALATRQSVSVVFDDGTNYCYVNRLTVIN